MPTQQYGKRVIYSEAESESISTSVVLQDAKISVSREKNEIRDIREQNARGCRDLAQRKMRSHRRFAGGGNGYLGLNGSLTRIRQAKSSD